MLSEVEKYNFIGNRDKKYDAPILITNAIPPQSSS